MHYTIYLGRDHRPPATNMTNFLTVTSVQAGFEPTQAGGERSRDMRQMSWPLDHGGPRPTLTTVNFVYLISTKGTQWV
jgi:hypothetical protein